MQRFDLKTNFLDTFSAFTAGTNVVDSVKPVFPNLFLASAPFSYKQISIAPLPCLAHVSTQFFRILYLGCMKMTKTRMSAKMHFTKTLNLVNSLI